MTHKIPSHEAAEFLGISVASLQKAATRGWIAYRWGRTPYGQKCRLFSLEELTAYRERQRMKNQIPMGIAS